MKDKDKVERLWMKIFPLQIGEKVFYVQNREKRHSPWKRKHIGKEGIVSRIIDEKWKNGMVKAGCYGKIILKETMYEILFEESYRDAGAFRGCELRRMVSK